MMCGICSKNSLVGEKRKEGEKRRRIDFFKTADKNDKT